LAWQQQVFDPLQQVVANNCHLHCYTEQTIQSIFLSSLSSNDDSIEAASAAAVLAQILQSS